MDNANNILSGISDGRASQPSKAQPTLEAELDGARRRWQALDQVLQAIRVELMPPRMMLAALSALQRATHCAGAMVINTHNVGQGAGILHLVGQDNPAIAGAAQAALKDEPAGAVPAKTASGEQLIVCRISTRFGGCPGVVLWREPDAPAWDHDDLALLGVASSVIRIVLEHEAMQQEMALQARTDPLTGLANRRAFLDEAGRRIERTHRESTSATLLVVDLDRFQHLNDRLGHDVGDSALVATTDLLRRTFRPTDLIARVGGDQFAVWLDGADALSSAERAESLCRLVAGELDYMWDSTSPEDTGALRISIGIAMRWPHGEEDVDTLMRQAEHALAAVKSTGGGQWRVFRAEDSVVRGQ